MVCKQFNLEELQNMFDKEQNLEELNKIMGAIVDKREVISAGNEEPNNTQLEEEIYQQMKPIKLENLDVIACKKLGESQRKTMKIWWLKVKLMKLMKNITTTNLNPILLTM